MTSEFELSPDRDDLTAGLQRRLTFLNLDQEDARRLREQLPVFQQLADDYVSAFYGHLLAHEETARFLSDPALVERLKQLQREHFASMFEARWDEDYAERRQRVGDVHARRGVEPQFFLGAYNLFLQFYLPRLLASGSRTSDPEPLLSLLKAVFLDIGATLDAYFLQFTRDLQQALDLLWKANTELKQFAHFTSHDLKTPLGTVANLCEEAIDEFGDQMPAEARSLIEAARRTVFRMSSTIDELLSASVASHESHPEEHVPGESLINDALERVQPILRKRRIEVVRDSSFPTVVGNRAQLREVFFNLLSNAAKYIERDAGRIEIRAQSESGQCVFTVADNGPGIPRDELERIFAPFRRLATHQDVPGSGLGLYFTRNLVERQGGRIWAESEPGQGGRFFVLLRCADRSEHNPGGAERMENRG